METAVSTTPSLPNRNLRGPASVFGAGMAAAPGVPFGFLSPVAGQPINSDGCQQNPLHQDHAAQGPKELGRVEEPGSQKRIEPEQAEIEQPRPEGQKNKIRELIKRLRQLFLPSLDLGDVAAIICNINNQTFPAKRIATPDYFF